MKKLSDEDIERLAVAIAGKINQSRPAPYVLPMPYQPYYQYPYWMTTTPNTGRPISYTIN